MARSKKSRNPGQIGSPKSKVHTPQGNDKKKKANKGHASGSRNSLIKHEKAGTVGNSNRDQRLGSKKKIDLLGTKKSELKKRVIPKFKSPLEELDFIESDRKLQSLLDRLDNEITITADEKSYVDTLLSRHKVLCDLLGIESEELTNEGIESETGHESTDLFDKLEKDFKF